MHYAQTKNLNDILQKLKKNKTYLKKNMMLKNFISLVLM